jgi:hypothetical protein
VSDTAYQGAMEPGDWSSDFNVMRFIAKQIMAGAWTATLVKVINSASDGELALAGVVDVQPMVNQIDGEGNATAHGTIFGVPYFRLQGGTFAVIMDPQPGDIGIAIFASRDISSVKATKDVANPGSRRKFDPADALYLGGFLNAVPETWIRVSADGIELGDGGGTAVFKDGTLTVSVDVVANGISLHDHHHSGVTTGSGDTGPPT